MPAISKCIKAPVINLRHAAGASQRAETIGSSSPRSVVSRATLAASAITLSKSAAVSASSSRRLRRPLTNSTDWVIVSSAVWQARCTRCGPRLGRSLARLAVQAMPATSVSPVQRCARCQATIDIARAVSDEQ
ncbi:MAG: hypothetical protein R3C10_07650 [Pirellulales bacterium]